MTESMTPSEGEGYDALTAARVISGALALPGGAGLVIAVLGKLPAVSHTAAHKSLFRSSPEQVEIGQWRYTASRDNRLRVAHVVNGIVLAEHPLPATAAGDHVAGALGQHVDEHGSRIVPEVAAALAGLTAAVG